MNAPDGSDPRAAAAALTGLTTQAGHEPLLLALDFDGVCAPLGDDPAASRMLPGTRTAVLALQAAGCRVALVSGRSLASLKAVADPAPGWLLVGGHGAEPDDGDAPTLAPERAELLRGVSAEVDDLVAAHPGTWSEHKPTGVVLHTRRADAATAAAVTGAVLAGPASRAGVHVRRGHDVVELSVLPADKGTAVRELRARTGAATVVYVGDDVTDEDAFAVLDPGAGDVGVKVGPGATAAAQRVATPQDVTGLLEHLLRVRSGAPPPA